MMRLLAATLLVWQAAACWAAPRAQQDSIDALLAAIESSGCEFERNGSRYAAREGAEHLRMKLERAGERVQTAREFIEGIASGSSQSGRPYLVHCAGHGPQRSRDWLGERLRGLEPVRK